ncbi:MAG TPA: hypothetical protein VEF04_07700 [Blastocatellia bacterium]|nr:hypothetical protein [Blastocatellia bacterium]
MQVRFIKESPDKYRLECIRDDGSMTSARLEFRGYFKHDLMHFVVESKAKLQDSFFGLVKSGKDLTELSPKAIRESAAVFPAEIQTTEIIVGALQGAAKTEADNEEVCRKIEEYLSLISLAKPDYLTPEFCTQVTAEHRSLLGRWGQLHGGESLEFSFS